MQGANLLYFETANRDLRDMCRLHLGAIRDAMGWCRTTANGLGWFDVSCLILFLLDNEKPDQMPRICGIISQKQSSPGRV